MSFQKTGNAGKTSVITVGSAAWHEHSRNIPVGGKNPECLRKILRTIIFPILEVIHFLHKCRLVVTKPTFKTLWKIITGKHAADFSECEQPQRPGLVKQFRISQGIQQGAWGFPAIMAYRISFSLSSRSPQAAAYWQRTLPHVFLQYRPYIQRAIPTKSAITLIINSISFYLEWPDCPVGDKFSAF